MEPFTFEASDSTERITCMTSLALVVLFAFFVYFIQRKARIPGPFRQLGVLLGSFLIVLSVGVGIFSYWQWSRLGTITITEKLFTQGKTSIPLSEIASYRIVSESSGRGLMRIDNGKADIFLSILTTNQKSFILMEENYDIPGIKERLDLVLNTQ